MDIAKKIKSFVSLYKFEIILVLIVLFGLLLRLIGINKPGGFWYDEIHSYVIAKESFPFGILDFLYREEFHAPLYYFFLHFWVKLFGEADFIIRLSSILFGLATIPTVYLLGKEISSKKVGLIAALLASISSFLIYYSQEVRFYSLLAFFGALSILFIARIKNNPDLKNYIGLILSNLVIIYTSTIGFVFVFWEVMAFAAYLFFTHKKGLKNFIIAQAVIAGLFSPYLPILLHQMSEAGKGFTGAFWWTRFTPSSILFVLQDWFSPVLVGIINPSPDYYLRILSGGIDFFFISLVLIPLIIFLTGVINAVRKKNFVSLLVSIAFLFFLTEIITASLGRLALMSRYTTLVYPIIIVAAAYGLLNIKNNKLAVSLISIVSAISLIFILTSPMSAPNLMRPEGYKIPGYFLSKYSPGKKDIVIMPYCGRAMTKYFSMEKTNLLPFDYIDTFQFNFKGTLERVLDKNIIGTITKKNAYNKLRSYISSTDISKPFENYFKSEVVNKVQKGRYVILVISRGVAFMDENALMNITSNDDIYKEQSLFFMLSSKATNDLLKVSYKYLTPVTIEKSDVWEMHVLQKP